MLSLGSPVHPAHSRFLGGAPSSTLACPGGLGQSHVGDGLGQVSVTPPDGSTCLRTAGSGPLSHVWLSLAGTVQASQPVATVHVTRQSGTLASQLLHVSDPRTEPLLGAATPLPFAHLPTAGRAWSACDLGSFGTAIGSSLITFSLTC